LEVGVSACWGHPRLKGGQADAGAVRRFEVGVVLALDVRLEHRVSEFVFAADLARVDLDENTGEIRLWIHTALQGEESHFQWIAYQVVATYVRVGTSIEGTIRWPTSLMSPASHFPSAVEPHFKIFANHREMSAGTSELQPWEVLTPVVQGHVERLSVASGECTAHYRIENPPMAMPLKVTVTVDSAFASRTVVAERSTGPEIFTLSPMHPSEVVDFMLAGLEVR
jgi:hypothetical protein